MINLGIGVATGNRGALALAETFCIGGYRDFQSDTTSFFGDMPLLTAYSKDECISEAEAQARNVLGAGSIKKVTRIPKLKGKASAAAALSWRGKVVWNADQPPKPTANLDSQAILPQQVILPDPNDVISAMLSVDYSIDIGETGIKVNDDDLDTFLVDGLLNIEHSWNNEKSFDGSVTLNVSKLPTIEGDLIPYSNDFILTESSIFSSNLLLNDVYSVAIDYLDFFDTGEISLDFSGAIDTSASTTSSCPCEPIPEPNSTLSLIFLGLIGAASTLKRKLKTSKSAEKETTKVG